MKERCRESFGGGGPSVIGRLVVGAMQAGSIKSPPMVMATRLVANRKPSLSTSIIASATAD